MLNKTRNFFTLSVLFLLAADVFSQPCVNPVTANCADAIAGTSDFIMTTSGNVDFEFDDLKKYVAGYTQTGSTRLCLKVDQNPGLTCKWRLIMYVDNGGLAPADEWESLAFYGASGDIPELDLIQVSVYNGCGTPVANGTYRTFLNNVQYDILEIIPPLAAQNLPAPCDGTQVNGPGSYLTDYNEFTFTVDYRIIPAFTLRPGAYQIKIRFCLVEVP